MINEILLYIGAGVITLWGIAHIVPTKAIVNGFEAISEDNKKIITMESIAEGITLCFVGVLVLLVTSLADSQSQAANIVYLACGVMLLIMAILTALTGARTSILPYKICPAVKTIVAILFILGSVL
jgi:chromate transport protein ChrA